MDFFKKLFGSKDKPNHEPERQSESPLEAYRKVPFMTNMRLASVAICLEAGFKPSNSLPTEWEKALRPSIEIAGRLAAIKALVLWLMAPEDDLPSERLLSFIDRNELERFMTDEEKEILSASRDDEAFRAIIGWKFENAWALAWYFGYLEPEITGEMMTGEQMQDILFEHACPLDENIADWVKNQVPISLESLTEKEDLFYCLHNAVRSAQLGRNTVPSGFDPIGNGGVIHERRHALTWMLSNGIAWDDTELAT
jgi:Domain of unknown function (DUF4272)